MGDVFDGQQPAANAEMAQAILTGQAHVVYALSASVGLVLYAQFVGGKWLPVALVLAVILIVGSLVDIYIHGFTH